MQQVLSKVQCYHSSSQVLRPTSHRKWSENLTSALGALVLPYQVLYSQNATLLPESQILLLPHKAGISRSITPSYFRPRTTLHIYCHNMAMPHILPFIITLCMYHRIYNTCIIESMIEGRSLPFIRTLYIRQSLHVSQSTLYDRVYDRRSITALSSRLTPMASRPTRHPSLVNSLALLLSFDIDICSEERSGSLGSLSSGV